MLVGKHLFPVLFLFAVSVLVVARSFKSLTIVDKVPVAHDQVNGSFAVRLPMKCGPDGMIYVRFAAANAEPGVTLIREDGRIASEIGLSKIPEFSENDFYDFAPGEGDVLLLSGHGKPHAPTLYYLSRFKTDGTYISSVKVDTEFRPDFEPLQIGEFPSGNLLIAGVVKGHDVPFVPFTGIFSADGQFQREVLLAADVSKKDAKQEASDTNFSEADQIRNLIEVSSLQGSDDGNIYLTRHTPRGPVFVVSPGGSVRRLMLIPPGENLDLQWVMASRGSIVAHYRDHDGSRHKAHYLMVIDVSTDKVSETVRYLHDYQTNGVGMACYQHGTFTFIAGAPDHRLQLVKAVAQ